MHTHACLLLSRKALMMQDPTEKHFGDVGILDKYNNNNNNNVGI